jgi:chromosome segregation ATPase
MLLKISLGLAILAGLATLYVSHVQVGGRITEMNETITTTQADLERERGDHTKAKAENRRISGLLDERSRELGEATNMLAAAVMSANEQRQRADKAVTDLQTVTGQRNEAQQELSQWRLFEMTPEQIRQNLARLRAVERERDVFTEENKAMTRTIRGLQARLRRYEPDGQTEPPLPPNTTGTVVAVDPKYDFVVLNIGGNQGLVENATMLVNRNGKLVGRVRITTVQPDSAIANVMPEWRQSADDEIMEGDQVISYN